MSTKQFSPLPYFEGVVAIEVPEIAEQITSSHVFPTRALRMLRFWKRQPVSSPKQVRRGLENLKNSISRTGFKPSRPKSSVKVTHVREYNSVEKLGVLSSRRLRPSSPIQREKPAEAHTFCMYRMQDAAAIKMRKLKSGTAMQNCLKARRRRRNSFHEIPLYESGRSHRRPSLIQLIHEPNQ